nr:immunoglobulin heavy chain junction region [Macaca mulatta]
CVTDANGSGLDNW